MRKSNKKAKYGTFPKNVSENVLISTTGTIFI